MVFGKFRSLFSRRGEGGGENNSNPHPANPNGQLQEKENLRTDPNQPNEFKSAQELTGQQGGNKELNTPLLGNSPERGNNQSRFGAEQSELNGSGTEEDKSTEIPGQKDPEQVEEAEEQLPKIVVGEDGSDTLYPIKNALKEFEQKVIEELGGNQLRQKQIEALLTYFHNLLESNKKGLVLDGVQVLELHSSSHVDGEGNQRYSLIATVGDGEFVNSRENLFEPFMHVVAKEKSLPKGENLAVDSLQEGARSRILSATGQKELNASTELGEIEVYVDFNQAYNALEASEVSQKPERLLADIILGAKRVASVMDRDLLSPTAEGNSDGKKFTSYELGRMAVKLVCLYEQIRRGKKIPPQALQFTPREISAIATLFDNGIKALSISDVPRQLSQSVWEYAGLEHQLDVRYRPGSGEKNQKLIMLSAQLKDGELSSESIKDVKDVLKQTCLGCAVDMFALYESLDDSRVYRLSEFLQKKTYRILDILSRLPEKSLHEIIDDSAIDPTIRGLAVKASVLKSDLDTALKRVHRKIAQDKRKKDSLVDLELNRYSQALGALNFLPPDEIQFEPELILQWYRNLKDLPVIYNLNRDRFALKIPKGWPKLPEWLVLHAVPKERIGGKLYLLFGQMWVRFERKEGKLVMRVMNLTREAEVHGVNDPMKIQEILRVFESRSLASFLLPGKEGDISNEQAIRTFFEKLGERLSENVAIAPWGINPKEQLNNGETDILRVGNALTYLLDELEKSRGINKTREADGNASRIRIPYSVYREFMKKLGYNVPKAKNYYGNDVSSELVIKITDPSQLFLVPKQEKDYLTLRDLEEVSGFKVEKYEGVPGFGSVQKGAIKITPLQT